MTAARPFGSAESLAETADRTWRGLSKDDWLEAFSAHPPIGVAGTGPFGGLHPPPNSSTPKAGSVQSRAWSLREQSGTRGATPETLAELALLNRDYAERFGHVFLVCATGKSAAEILALGRQRLHNDPEAELAIVAEEQRKITRLRLEKLLSPTEQ
jgi:OHCU decarboxylase